MTAEVLPMHPNPLLSAALAYASLGWHILPAWWIVEVDGKRSCACGKSDCIKSAGKHPIGKVAPWGQNSATVDAEKIKLWWEQYPNANIAAYLEPSKLAAIDIDPRNGGLDTIDQIEAKHGKLDSDLLQFTGGGGEHRVFQLPAGNVSMPGKLGPGVDVKLNGYIMLEPSSHLSGGMYSWEASSDPRDGIVASPMPDWLRDLAFQRLASPPVAGPSEERTLPVTAAQMAEIEQALGAIPSDDRDTWLTVGMALQSTEASQWAYDTWCKWSEQSSKFDPQDQLRVWRSTRARGLDGITYRTIFELAKRNGVVVKSEPVLMEPVAIDDEDSAPTLLKLREQRTINIDSRLLRPPGILGVVTDYVNATAKKSQPQFAVQTAIAFACTVLGRRFVTNNANWPSLYLMNVGKSSSGKEWAKTASEALLEACGLANLIGPSGYTSSSGVLSSLLDQPNHMTVIDEFHRELEKASVKGNAHSMGMIKTVMEVWGRNNGALRPQGHSTLGQRKGDKEKAEDRTVRNPAITLLAMTIPDFFESIGSAAARDGFLNRFLIVESDIGRQPSLLIPSQEVPQPIVDWATEIRARYTGLICPDTNAIASPSPVMVPITEAAMSVYQAFDIECLGYQNQYEKDGLAEMFGRTNETAMKLGLVIALGRGDTAVKAEDAEWACMYCKTYALRTVERLIGSMADSEFEATKNQVLNLLVSVGKHGLTVREINQRSRKFRALDQRQQVNLLNSLAFVGQVQHFTFPPPSGRGKPRNAWVAIDDSQEPEGGDHE